MTTLTDREIRAAGPACSTARMTRADWAVLIFLMALAFAMRIWWVREPLVDSYSWREASTAMMADNFRLGSWNIFYPEVNWVGRGPGYQGREFQLLSYTTAVLHSLFGWHDWFGRLVAICFSMITIFSLHRLVAVIWDVRHAHAAALVYAIMPAAVTIDSSFLPDPAMLSLVTLGVWLFTEYWLAGRGKWLLLFSTLAFTLGVLGKLPGIAAGAVPFYLVIVAGLRNGWKGQVPAILAMFLSLGLIVAYYSWAIYLGATYPPYHVAGSGYIWDEGFRKFLADRFYVADLLRIARWWYYGIPLMVAFAVGLWTAPPEGVSDRFLAAVPFVWLGSFCLLYAAGASEITNNPWNFHILSIPFAIFAGRGLVFVTELSGAQFNSAGGLLRAALIATVVAVGTTWPLVNSIKTPKSWDGLTLGRALGDLKKTDELAVLISPDVGDPVALYYARTKGWVFPPGGDGIAWSLFYDTDEEAVAALEQLRSEGAVWFGYATSATDDLGRSFVSHHAKFIEWLNANFEKVVETPEIVIYRL